MRPRRWALYLLAIGTTVGAVALCPRPFPWLFALWALTLLGDAAFRIGRARFGLFNAAVVLATLAVVEIAWSERESVTRERVLEWPAGFWRRHEVLGYAPAVHQQARVVCRSGDEVLFDVVYHIGPDGLRVAPPCRCRADTPALLFFGCSYTFGEGVRDEETLPYRTGVLSGQRYAVYNFGGIGYGAHQMVAALRSGLVADVVEHPPAHVFYTVIWGHLRRSAGRVPWDQHGPRFAVDERGELVHLGPFDETSPLEPRLAVRVTGRLRSSNIVRRLWPAFGWEPELQLVSRLVREARVQVERSYPGARFHVVLWERDPRRDRVLADRLGREGVTVHPVRKILPDLSEHPSRYRMPGDGHPTAAAYDAVARYLVDSVIGVGSPPNGPGS